MAPSVAAPVAYRQARNRAIRKIHAVREYGSVVVDRIVKRSLRTESWRCHTHDPFISSHVPVAELPQQCMPGGQQPRAAIGPPHVEVT